ncbi:hypothetical protein BT93_L0024 [Corymbia citriodora subsp. variegata]|uniref:Uncharacterized protein n=1 Tax=Corymbia citriodora subsp. variegata TaxID=360336 RepID=A0A8T0CVI8_CORYI|nr:hypothetical protein BT93_L0024 [Corymbia citriodora subsp. variegata]
MRQSFHFPKHTSRMEELTYCPGKSAWPELVGRSGNVAAGIVERENHNVKARVLLEGSPTTRDFRCDRVWVWVDRNGKVTQVPRIG